jgi:hypothetical protein
MSNSPNNSLTIYNVNENNSRIHSQSIEDMKKKMSAELAHFKERDYQWLWNYLSRRIKYLNNAYRRDKDKPFARLDRMAEAIVVNGIQLIEIIDDHADKILELSHFEWIDQKNIRQLIFINYLILKRDNRDRNNELLNSPDLFNQIINNFDSYWGMGRREKIEKLNNFEREWDKKRVPDNLIKWIDSNNALQLEWALNYLKKREEWIKDLEVDSAKKHLYALILASLDHLSLKSRPESLQLFMTKMSKTWSQKKFRDQGKTKSPYHIPLTKLAKVRLDDLAELYGVKNNAILEMLINQEYEKEMLDEKHKKKFR